MKIEEIDERFKVKGQINEPGLKFFDVTQKPFKIYGLMREEGHFARMPMSIAKTLSDGVAELSRFTSGGRIRFKTDSPYVAIFAKYGEASKVPQFAFTGSIGFDLFSDFGNKETYTGTFIPECDIEDTLESIVYSRRTGIRTVTVYFPLYSCIDEVFIGLDENSLLEEADDYTTETPVVYYGSSITTGGCASRPGNSYSNIITRNLSVNSLNLGFPGSAKGEIQMAEYIAGLKMTAFVFDYDHNAPNAEHLKATHEPFFKTVRAAHPNLPIIMLSRPTTTDILDDEVNRFNIIKKTYDNAVSTGDKNVFLINGSELFCDKLKELALVDGTHPNDCGFADMAEKISEILKKVI